MRTLRSILKMTVPVVGMILVIGAVLFEERLAVQLFLVVAGLLLIEASVWRLTDPILPDERKFLALRVETDHFTALVRQLNAAALSGHAGDTSGAQFALDEVQTEMHRSVDRMVAFAGKTGDEVPPSEAGGDSAPRRPSHHTREPVGADLHRPGA